MMREYARYFHCSTVRLAAIVDQLNAFYRPTEDESEASSRLASAAQDSSEGP